MGFPPGKHCAELTEYSCKVHLQWNKKFMLNFSWYFGRSKGTAKRVTKKFRGHWQLGKAALERAAQQVQWSQHRHHHKGSGQRNRHTEGHHAKERAKNSTKHKQIVRSSTVWWHEKHLCDFSDQRQLHHQHKPQFSVRAATCSEHSLMRNANCQRGWTKISTFDS